MLPRLASLWLAAAAVAQATPPSPPATPQDPAPVDPARQTPKPPPHVLITATRTGADPFELPYSTKLFDQTDFVTTRQVRTLPELLREQPGVSVQKTALGQGSPKFRGQTGFQTLLLVDGIRMNDSTWRSGNVEYWNHLDPYSFDRFEIVRGPTSVLWGSDANSGVGHAFSKSRTDFTPGFHAGAGILFRYASAENSAITHTETYGNIDDFGWHVGFSYKDFNDLEAGREVGVLPRTGYLEADGDLNLTWRIDDHARLTFATQHNNLRDVPRTHSTNANVGWRGITAGSDLRRNHTHRRWLSYVKYEDDDAGGLFDSFWVTAAFKHRFEREDRLRSNGRRIFQESDVQTPALIAQATKDTSFGSWVFGVDWYHDGVDSEQREHAADGTLLATLPRGVVAGDARYDMAGLFAQDEIALGPNTDLLLGARYQYVNLSAKDVAAAGITTVDRVSDNWHNVTGSVRLVQRYGEDTRVFAGISQSFRAPNLSDTTRLDIGRTNEQEIPATDLKPEYYTTAELGTRVRTGALTTNLTGYYTMVDDQIGRIRTGATNANGEFLVTKDNVGDGWYAGFELENQLALDWVCAGLANWALVGWMDYVDARLDQIDSAGNPTRDRPSAVPPPSGRIGLRWDHPTGQSGFEAFTNLAYHVNPSRYTEADRQNTSRIPPAGLPGYAVFGMRGFVRLSERTTASFAVENINNVDHRIMDSGLNEPGTNAIFTVETRF
jgi:hemoglobin/transferrin/lactoferrin receptor protein